MKKSLVKRSIIAVLAATSIVTNIVPIASAKETLEFYHGYHHQESEWPVAKVMRDLYEKFAAEYSNDEVEFTPIPVTGALTDIMNNKVASGEFPDVIDLAGNQISLAALEQGLVYDLKPYIDENGLENNVGINYTQNDVGGHIFSVHEQLFTMGLWYNKAIFEKAGAKSPDQWVSWDDFTQAMQAVRTVDGVYAFGAGQPAIRIFNTYLGLTQEGRDLLSQPISAEVIQSEAFTQALKAVMTEIQANGSENAGGNADEYSADFVAGKSAVFFNGVWAAGGMVENQDIAPGIYAGNIGISSAGGGITLSSKLTEPETKLALEFLKYMTSDEVQQIIFEKVGANPSNINIDVAALSETNEDPTVKLLGQAISQVKNAEFVVKTIGDAWGGDINDALINALSESSAEGVDINQKVEETKNVLLALIS